MYKDLSLKEKAKVIREGVRLGLNSIDDILSLYDEATSYLQGEILYQDGGDAGIYYGKYNNKRFNTQQGINDLREWLSAKIMSSLSTNNSNEKEISFPPAFTQNGGTAQASYLLSRKPQRDMFLRHGYIQGKNKDYGLVRNAVGNRDIPVYQTAEDANVKEENLINIGWKYNNDASIPEDTKLFHAGYYPTATYIDGKTGLIYLKSWDLNDYYNPKYYKGIKRIGSKIIDLIGSPVVITTGYLDTGFNALDNNWKSTLITPQLNSYLDSIGMIKDEYGIHLPEVIVTPNEYKKGGPIVSPYGQWKYPGKDTIIPSNNITMDNVNYPVLGISDAGDAKVMMPWNDYKFKGSMVYEHPLVGNLALEGKRFNKKWKALDNILYNVYPDTTFTREKTGIGDIEVFNRKNGDTITYPNGYRYINPYPGLNTIVYNPNTNDTLDIRLDALHLMPLDATYDALNTLYRNNALGSDVYYIANKRYEEDKKRYGKDNIDSFSQYYNNEADGLLRNMFIEGSPEYIESKRYYPNKQQLREWNIDLLPYINEIQEYLETGKRPKYILPEVVITPNKYLKGGETQKYLNVPEYNIALYNTVSPLGDFPNFWGALAYRRLVKDKLKNGNIYERDYKVGDTLGEKTAMAAWAKRLGIPYDKLDLPVYNGDTVTLPNSLVLEIPYDTNMLKNRIQLNKALLDKYSKYRYSDVVNAAIEADLYNLDKLRETYKTGKPVGLTEFGWNSRQLVNNGEILPIEDIYSPLNVLGNYNVRYDKPTNRLYYSDEYDFNQFENFVPGEPYRIRGYIDLDNNKALGGNLFKKGGIYINPKNKGKFNATKKRTGKTTEELTHSKNPLTRKRAIFAQNAKHWNHKHDEGGHLYSEGGFLLAPYLYNE